MGSQKKFVNPITGLRELSSEVRLEFWRTFPWSAGDYRGLTVVSTFLGGYPAETTVVGHCESPVPREHGTKL